MNLNKMVIQRNVFLVFALAAAVLVLSGCSKQQNADTDMTPDEIKQQIKDSISKDSSKKKDKETGMVRDKEKQQIEEFVNEDSDNLYKISIVSATDRGTTLGKDGRGKDRKADGRFIEVVAKIESVSSHTTLDFIKGYYFKLTDSMGRLSIDSEKHVEEDLIAEGTKPVDFVDSLEKGQSRTFDLFFDVPKDKDDLYLNYADLTLIELDL